MEEGCSKRINVTGLDKVTQGYCQIAIIPTENLKHKNSSLSFGVCPHPNASESECPIAHSKRQEGVGTGTDDEVRYLWD